MASFDRDNFQLDNLKIVLPPPPTKSKLKRVNTIPGTGNDNGLITEHDDNNATKALSNNTTPNQSIRLSSGEMIFLDGKEEHITATSTVVVDDNDNDEDDNDDCSLELWTITDEQLRYYLKQFSTLEKHPQTGNVPGHVAKVFFEKSDLDVQDLSRIWKLSDVDEDGQLSAKEFCIAMHLVVLRRNRVELPAQLPNPLLALLTTIKTSDTSRHDDERRQSQTRWTRFNDNEEKEKIPSKPSGSSPSLANFDYNPESLLATNPNIRHPVPVRVTPITTSPPAQFFLDDPLTTKHRVSSSSMSSSPSSASSWPSGTGHEHLINSLSNGSSANNTGSTKTGLTKKQIVDYLCNLEHRYIGPTAANISSPEISPPKSDSDLHQTIRWLRETNQALTRRNQEMVRDINHLIRITKRLILDHHIPPDS